MREIYKVYKTRIWLEQVGGTGSLGRQIALPSVQRDVNFTTASPLKPTSLESALQAEAPPFHAKGAQSAVVSPDSESGSPTAAARMATEVATAALDDDEATTSAQSKSLGTSQSEWSRTTNALFSPEFICPISQDIMVSTQLPTRLVCC